ncbi:hypothetical protein B0H17DRAFT_1199198 [Mycena rosella]|uniref:Uncharacterized protein n=1 Tax=Mycena rosella TaxID=1033263 RepID=A0AAD7GJX2_MYCRO|nr:hypothetical protein B0H17DRAFT_1199198 [Mycena rosella]
MISTAQIVLTPSATPFTTSPAVLCARAAPFGADAHVPLQLGLPFPPSRRTAQSHPSPRTRPTAPARRPADPLFIDPLENDSRCTFEARFVPVPVQCPSASALVLRSPCPEHPPFLVRFYESPSAIVLPRRASPSHHSLPFSLISLPPAHPSLSHPALPALAARPPSMLQATIPACLPSSRRDSPHTGAWSRNMSVMARRSLAPFLHPCERRELAAVPRVVRLGRANIHARGARSSVRYDSCAWELSRGPIDSPGPRAFPARPAIQPPARASPRSFQFSRGSAVLASHTFRCSETAATRPSGRCATRPAPFFFSSRHALRPPTGPTAGAQQRAPTAAPIPARSPAPPKLRPILSLFLQIYVRLVLSCLVAFFAQSIPSFLPSFLPSVLAFRPAVQVQAQNGVGPTIRPSVRSPRPRPATRALASLPSLPFPPRPLRTTRFAARPSHPRPASPLPISLISLISHLAGFYSILFDSIRFLLPPVPLRSGFREG